MPKYVCLELTPPDTQHRRLFACREDGAKLGYNASVTRRTPSALCGDGMPVSLRAHRRALDINRPPPDLQRYLATACADGAIARPPAPSLSICGFGRGLHSRRRHVAGVPRHQRRHRHEVWGSTTYAHLLGWHTNYGKGAAYDIHHIAPTITSFAS